MPERDFELRAARGLRLSGHEWMPEGPAAATVCLAHGFGEHRGRWAHAGKHFAARGFATAAADLRGHGRSEGRRGHALNLGFLLDDLGLLLAEARRAHPDCPVFVYGHSLGALIASNYVLRRTPALAGVVLSALPLETPLREQRLKLAAARVLGPVLPGLSIDAGLDDVLITRELSFADARAADPLMHSTATLGLARAALDAVEYAIAHAPEWRLPVLIMHGAEDRLSLPSGAERLAERISGDCTLKLWPGLHHEPHNERERLEVLDYVADWIEQRAARR